MGILTTLTTVVTSLLAKKAAGHVAGLLVSKTQYGASAAGLGGLWAVLPGVLAREPEAIGTAVLIIGGWLMALYGRMKAR